MCKFIEGIITCFQRKTIASENWQKLTKLLPFRSYSGSCCIDTPTKLSNEVTIVTKKPFSISSLLIPTESMSGLVAFDILPLHFLHFKSRLGFRGSLMFEQHLCTQKPQTRHLIELDPTPLLHTPQENLLQSTGLEALRALTMIFVLPTFTCRPFFSKLVFQTRKFSNN